MNEPWRPGCFLRTIRFAAKVRSGQRVVAAAFKPTVEDENSVPAGLSVFDCGNAISTDNQLEVFIDFATAVAKLNGSNVGRLGVCHVFDKQLEDLGLPPRQNPDPAMGEYSVLHNLIPIPNEDQKQLLAQYATRNGHVQCAIDS